MARPMNSFTVTQLMKIVKAVEDPFKRRDEKWKHRRTVRYRQMESELKQLPLSTRGGRNQALMIFQTEEPNQEAHRRTKRLVANKPRIEVIIYASDEATKKLAQDVKDVLKALYKWVNRAKVPAERKVVEYQQADGCGIFKCDYIADYTDDALMYYDPDVLVMDAVEGEDEGQTKARNSFQSKSEYYTGEAESMGTADEMAYDEGTGA